MTKPVIVPSTRPRILQIGKYYPPYRGGMESHLSLLCRCMKSYADVEVLVSSSSRCSTHDHVDGIRVTRAGTAFSVRSAPFCPALLFELRKHQADLVHIHVPNPGATLARMVARDTGPLVVTYHSDTVRQTVLRRLYAPILRSVLSQADAIIVTSPNYLDSSPVLAEFRSRCRVIPLAIEPEQFSDIDLDAVAKIRSQFGERIVLSLGRHVYYKGFEFLIRAMRDTSARLLLIGDGPLRPSLEREAAACGVAGSVVFLGEVEDPRPYYHAADVFAFPSVARSEAFGIAQLEAMACARPVVNTNLDTGVPFVSLDGVTGVTVPPADAVALARALNLLLDDRDLRLRMGAAARERALTEFSAAVMGQRTIDLYSQVLMQRRVPEKPAPRRTVAVAPVASGAND